MKISNFTAYIEWLTWEAVNLILDRPDRFYKPVRSNTRLFAQPKFSNPQTPPSLPTSNGLRYQYCPHKLADTVA